MIVIGNGSVLLTLAFTKNRKSRMNYFIMHLAIADLLVGLLNVLTDIAWKLTVEWHAGMVVCKLIKYLEAVVTFSSTYVLVALSIDRYDAIKHPMKFCGSWRRARIMVALAWLLSLLFSIPNLILFKEQMVEGINQCWIELTDWEWQVYVSLLMSAVFAIPAIIITACYAVIVSTIWRKGNRASILATAPRHRFKEKHKLEENETRRASSRGLIPRAKVKTIKMTFVIVFVFILCWSPYFLFNVLQVYGYVPKTQTFIAISTFIQSLAPLNSAANPIIYCLFSARLCRNFRRWRFLRWGGWWQPAPTEFNSTLTSSLTYSARRATLTSAVKTNRLSRSDRSRAVTVL